MIWNSQRRRIASEGRREPLLTRYDRAAWVIPTSALVVIVIVGELGPSIRIVNWLLMVPLLASGVCSPAVTLLFGAIVVVLNRYIDVTHPDVVIRTEDFVLEITASLLAFLIAVLRSQAHVYVRHLQSSAEATREVVLRPIPPDWGGVESAARYRAADVEARVGGDFYDVLATPFGARVVLGDVQGKGLPAVSTAGAVTGAFREAGYYEQDLDVVAQRMENGLRRHNLLRQAVGDQSERFATAVVLSFPDTDPHTVEVVNFGHDGPYVIGPRGVWQLPQQEGAPVGMADLVGGTPAVRRLPLEPGETVLLVTDGVTEARNRAGEFFPLRSWLEGLAGPRPGGVAPADLLGLLLDALREHTHGDLADDIALLAVRQRSPADLRAGGSHVA